MTEPQRRDIQLNSFDQVIADIDVGTGEMFAKTVVVLIHAYVAWELWSGTSRIWLRNSSADPGHYRAGWWHDFNRNSEDGSFYFWVAWGFKALILAVFWMSGIFDF